MSIFEKKDAIFREAVRESHPSKAELSKSLYPMEIYYQINEFVQLTELDILKACDWNLGVFSACQTLELCLTLADKKFNFQRIVSIVETKAVDLMMVLPISEDVFLKPFRHSSLIFGVLRACLKINRLLNFES
tara:strand:+ start:382 stop:780 length:399 start_codon:yes stop_codon:yes gene_type:complete